MPKDNPKGLDRVDGRAKVTGAAKYFAEYELPNMTYGVLVGSTVTKGRILALDTKAAEKAPGVLAVLSHLNRPTVPGYEPNPNPQGQQAQGRGGGTGGFKIFYTDKIFFNGQPIALVVADRYERALYAASLVKAQYEKEEHQTNFDKNIEKAAAPRMSTDYHRGEIDAYKNAPIKLEAEYTLPSEMHNPMELHGMLANWESDSKIDLYSKTQGVKATQRTVANLFKIPLDNITVYSEFVGGAFGIALRTWPHEIAAVMASKQLNRPVKLVLGRDQMFTMLGYRPHTWQKVGLGASSDGKLIGITHEATGQTATYEDFTEGVTNISRFMYASPNMNTRYKLLPLDVCVPTWMRGPGEATGAFALECAVDEMAHQLNMDPIEFRLKNYAETDPEKNLPFSSKFVKEAYELGAEKIGWKNRKAQPATAKDGDYWVGYGMSSGAFGAYRGAATVKGTLMADGTLLLQSATSDIGPGTGTAMVQIASQLIGIPTNKIRFELGNSSLPPSGSQGGSSTVSTVGSAVNDAVVALKQQLQEMAGKTAMAATPSSGEFVFKDGKISHTSNNNAGVSFGDLMRQNNLQSINVTKESRPGGEMGKYSLYSFSIHFVQVKVHRLTGVVHVSKIACVGDAGTIVSLKTAESQMIGGAVGGIGMALTEEAVMDNRYGRYVNNNLADYHVPVNADVPDIDVIFINKPDPIINPMGAKGMGEIALIGFSAAVANAVFNATGKRIRNLPITPDKLMA